MSVELLGNIDLPPEHFAGGANLTNGELARLLNLPADVVAAFARSARIETLSQALNISGGGTPPVFPGPPLGYIRVILEFSAVSTVSGQTLTLTSTLLPLNVGISIASTTLFVLGFGETIRTSNAAANAGFTVVTYIDVPATNFTLVRQPLTASAAEIAPAPPSGFVYRWLRAGKVVSGGTSVREAGYFYNGDSGAHLFEYLIGGQIAGRTGSVNAGLPIAAVGPTSALIRSAVSAKTVSAPTTSPYFFGCYEKVAA